MDIPKHLAIIIDGNRRWAKQRGLPALEGHREGYVNIKHIAETAFGLGIKYLTVYVFSTENWQRSKSEVNALMRLTETILRNETDEYARKGIRMRFWGSDRGVKPSLLGSFRKLETVTKTGTTGTLNICFNYGGRNDIVEAVGRLLNRPEQRSTVTEEDITGELSSAHSPAPDFIIRTGGHQRLSNFLLWEGAYSELYFSDLLWPDFKAAQLATAMQEYSRRKRNFGR